MSKFNQLYKFVLEKFLTPSYVKKGVPHSHEWVIDTSKKEPIEPEKTLFNWKGMPPEEWKGLAIINNLFNANNAGPFTLTTKFLQDYNKSTIFVKNKIDINFKRFLNRPDRTIAVEGKQSDFLGRKVFMWQIGHDIYLLFTIEGKFREVVWMRIFDDHQKYVSYLKTGSEK